MYIGCQCFFKSPVPTQYLTFNITLWLAKISKSGSNIINLV